MVISFVFLLGCGIAYSTLVALAIMIAELKSEEKEIMVSLVMNFIDGLER